MLMTRGKTKAELRHRLLAARMSIHQGQKYLWESAITKRVLALEEYQQAELVLSYYATPEELSAAPIIAHALCCGKRVALPRCVLRGEMDFCWFTHRDQLTENFYGLPQHPLSARALSRDELKEAFCLVPALGANRKGHRIGYGGGYYDRFLVNFKGRSAILTYDWALLEFEPECWDVAATLVVTPEEIIYLYQQ